jgi:hypothetical protein
MTKNDKDSGVWRPAGHLRRWMQVVGAFYVLQFVMMAIVRAPIRTFGPEGTLAKADAGDPVARFLVDTWTTFGLEVAAVGVTLLVATRRGELAKGVVWTVLAIEVGRGIVLDTYMIARGVHVAGYLAWIAIHSVVIATGLLALRADRTADDSPGVARKAAPARAT